MSLYYCWVTKMANAVVLWVLVYFCVTLVNTKDCIINADVCILSEIMNLHVCFIISFH